MILMVGEKSKKFRNGSGLPFIFVDGLRRDEIKLCSSIGTVGTIGLVWNNRLPFLKVSQGVGGQ